MRDLTKLWPFEHEVRSLGASKVPVTVTIKQGDTHEEVHKRKKCGSCVPTKSLNNKYTSSGKAAVALDFPLRYLQQQG